MKRYAGRDSGWRKLAGMGGLIGGLLVAAGGGAVAGCDDGKVGAGGGGGAGGAGGAGGGTAVDPIASACLGDIWIGRAPDGSCPPAGGESGWTGEELFTGTDDPTLKEYCMYTWKDDASKPTPGTLPALAGTPAAEWLDEDCAAVMSLGDTQEIVEQLASPLWGSFAQQMDAPPGLSLPSEPARVTVAIVDSWPGADSIGQLPHGFGMAGIVDGLTCALFAASPCPIKTVPHLSLNLLAPRERDNMDGGYFGHFSRLARQIHAAVNDFAATAGDQDHLVVNLALGWDEIFNQGGDPIRPVDAVHDVISWAACQGALVVAASGNTSGGPDPGEGPTYPAAWHEEAGPACVCPAAGTCPPLVFAASGVDGASLPLANARARSRAPLAAPAFAVPGVKDAGAAGGGLTIVGPFTGSSVAATAVSAAAAMVWAHDSSLSPAKVMARLHDAGVPLGVTADFCDVDPCPDEVKRVSLCQALEDTGVPVGVMCAPPSATDDVNPELSVGQEDAIAALAVSDFDGTSLTDEIQDASCGDVFVGAGKAEVTAISACPIAELPTSMLNMSVDPQPVPDPCPACFLFLDETVMSVILELAIDERVASPVHPQVLTLLQGEDVKERYDLAEATGRTDMSGGSVYQVRLPWFSVAYGTDWRVAQVEWLDETESTAKTSQLIVTVRP